MNRGGSFCRKPGSLVKRNRNPLCDYMITEPAQFAGIPVCDAGIPGGNFSSMLAGRSGESIKGKTGQRVTHC